MSTSEQNNHTCQDDNQEDEYKTLVSEFKSRMLEKLKDFDWLEQMRLKCRAYIENNGTKVISMEEILDFIKEEAIKSFPQIIEEEMREEMLTSLYNNLNNKLAY